MVLTVTLNPAIDRTIETGGFKINAVNRGRPILVSAGGKGINVSRAVLRLGGETEVLSVIGGETGNLVIKLLADEGINVSYVAVEGETRTCYGIIDKHSGTETVLNESGPTVDEKHRVAFIELFEKSVDSRVWVVLSGSVARGFGNEIYRNLISIANKKGARCVLDASGQLLRSGIEAIPYMVKLNREELASLGHTDAENSTEMVDEMNRLLKKGINSVVVTCGENGAYAMADDQLIFVKPPPVRAINTWGSGDCVVAGILAGFNEGKSFGEAIKYGVASGTANTLSYGAGFINIDEVTEIFKGVTSTKVR